MYPTWFTYEKKENIGSQMGHTKKLLIKNHNQFFNISFENEWNKIKSRECVRNLTRVFRIEIKFAESKNELLCKRRKTMIRVL